MKIVPMFILLMICPFLFGQPYRIDNFIDYKNVINDLKTHANDSHLKYKYDLTFVLLLDSSQIKLIEKIQPEAVKYFREYSSGLTFNNRTVGFVTDKKDIKEVLMDKLDQKRIFECVNEESDLDLVHVEFDHPIYVKENKAIFEIYGSTWSSTYFARLENGVLQINYLGGTIE